MTTQLAIHLLSIPGVEKLGCKFFPEALTVLITDMLSESPSKGVMGWIASVDKLFYDYED